MFSPKMSNSVKAVCKRCGRSADAETFVLDPVYKMMVCPLCVQERKKGTPQQAAAPQRKGISVEEDVKEKKQAPERPKGWDAEDDLLEKLSRQKEKVTGGYSEEGGHVKYRCMKCKFKFDYHPDKGFPLTCPYCGTKVAPYRR